MSGGVLWLQPAQPRRRFGLKGPRAGELLVQLSLNLPAQPNSWAPLRSPGPDESLDVICRLGHTEFFIEEQGDAPGIVALESSVRGLAGAYPVLREDQGMVLGGTAARHALAEVCNVNLAALPLARKPVVMTLMAGVSVLVLPQQTVTSAGNAATLYRIWCDPSFGTYLWETLAEVVSTTTGRAA